MRTLTLAAVAAALLTTLGLSGTSIAAQQAARAPTTSGLVLNYRFDNDTGVTAHDSSANAIHGTYVNTTAAAAKIAGASGMGSAINLVGSKRQYVSVPERNALDVNTFTVAAMVRYTGVQNPQTFGRWEVLEKPDAYWVNVRTNGRVRVGGFFGGCTNAGWVFLDSNVVLKKWTWTHVASTYNGSTLTVWVNGKNAGSTAVSGRTCSNNNPMAIGAKNYPAKGILEAFWDGRLDDIRLYNRALSVTEINGLRPG
jgi:Concanavalin A-like lectin/glucanases superfamily